MFSLFRLVIRTFAGRKKRTSRRHPVSRPTRDARTAEGRTDALNALAISSGEVAGEVIWVLDGDTVDVRIEGRTVRVRLDAIDCPEDGQPWGNTARAGLIKMIGRKSVLLEVHGVDAYGRMLATVFAAHGPEEKLTNVNERMVMLGHAWVMRGFCSHLPRERQAQLFRLETWARSKNVGLWRTPDPIPPWKWRRE